MLKKERRDRKHTHQPSEERRGNAKGGACRGGSVGWVGAGGGSIILRSEPRAGHRMGRDAMKEKSSTNPDQFLRQALGWKHSSRRKKKGTY